MLIPTNVNKFWLAEDATYSAFVSVVGVLTAETIGVTAAGSSVGESTVAGDLTSGGVTGGATATGLVAGVFAPWSTPLCANTDMTKKKDLIIVVVKEWGTSIYVIFLNCIPNYAIYSISFDWNKDLLSLGFLPFPLCYSIHCG